MVNMKFLKHFSPLVGGVISWCQQLANITLWCLQSMLPAINLPLVSVLARPSAIKSSSVILALALKVQCNGYVLATILLKLRHVEQYCLQLL